MTDHHRLERLGERAIDRLDRIADIADRYPPPEMTAEDWG